MSSLFKKKKKKKGFKIIIGGAIAPFLILTISTLIFSTIIMSFFSDTGISENLSDQENEMLIDYIKKIVQVESKDYYQLDKGYQVDWSIVLAYVKFYKATKDFSQTAGNTSVENTDIESLKDEIKNVYLQIKPNFTYEIKTITTIREWIEKVKEFKEEEISYYVLRDKPEDFIPYKLENKEIYIISSDEYYTIKENRYIKSNKPKELEKVKFLDEKPNKFDAKNLEVGSKYLIINEKRIYDVIEKEIHKSETKRENFNFLTAAENVKGTFNIKYREETNVIDNGNEKFTITKPVIEEIKQIDKLYDPLKNIIKRYFHNEDSKQAFEAIISLAGSYVNEDITIKDLPAIETGDATFIPQGEEFTGSKQDFINRIKDKAIEHQKKYGIKASITLAQAALESGWGESGLTTKANNLFGIKAFGWNGPYVEMMTRENDSSGGEYFVAAKFRAYASWDESIDDHAKILLQSNFAAVRSAATYREAAQALKAGGYATDVNYPSLIISTIESYRLYQYDN